jgi:Acyltransferase family
MKGEIEMASQMKQGPSLLKGAAGTAPPIIPGSAPPVTRLWFLDHLRIVLICGVVVVHVAGIYGAGGWYQYHEPAQADVLIRYALAIPSLIANLFGMGFFFLIAGYFTPGSYDRKGGASFVRDRLVRLGIPLLLYDLLLDPLVVYIARGLHGSPWSFYGPYLLQVRTIGPVVAWFITTLLLFTLFYAAWRWLTRKRSPVTHWPGKLPSTRAILGFIVALGLVSFVVRIWSPLRWDWLPPWWVQLFKPTSEFASPVSQSLCAWVYCLSPQLVRRAYSPDGKRLVADRTHRDDGGGPLYGVRPGSRNAERLSGWVALAGAGDGCVGSVPGRGRVSRLAGALSSALESAGEAGERLILFHGSGDMIK